MQHSIAYKTINKCCEVDRSLQALGGLLRSISIIRTQLLTQCTVCDKVLTDPSVSFFAPLTLPHKSMEKKVEELNRIQTL